MDRATAAGTMAALNTLKSKQLLIPSSSNKVLELRETRLPGGLLAVCDELCYAV